MFDLSNDVLFNLMYGMIIVLMMLILYKYAIEENQPKIKIVSSFGREYILAYGYNNIKEATDLLNHANERMFFLLCNLRDDYNINGIDNDKGVNSNNEKLNQNEINVVQHLLSNYNPDVFYENNPKLSNQTSWTVAKGKAMYICLRNKDDPNKLVDLNTLMFVLLHESSHIANYRSYGHDLLFWRTFKFMLEKAKKYNLYTPENYRKHPVIYCGVEINYQPLYDNTLQEL